jgi:diguanylate cyclase (GGDEF)-like protein
MDKSITADNYVTAYRDAVRAMRDGDFTRPIPVDAEAGPISELGLELKALSEKLAQHFNELSRMHYVTTKINSGIFIHDVLDCIYDNFHKIIPYDRIGYALISDDRTKVQAYWEKSNYREKIKITRGYTERLAGSSLETILATSQPRILNDLNAYLQARPESVSTRLIVAEGILSSLTCPLIVEGEPIGFLFFSSRMTNAYCHEHQRLFLYLASQVSSVLQKSRLYQQIYDLNQRLMASENELRRQASHDALTGILNRGMIMEFLRQQIQVAERKEQPLAVILADVDSFKTVNDTYGHPMGDAVLRTVAQTIEANLRAYDRVGRYGGEEFLIVLGGADAEMSMQIAERVREGIAAQSFQHGGHRLAVSLSLGVACRPADGLEDMECLVSQADQALYEAKHAGRNRVCLAGLLQR